MRNFLSFEKVEKHLARFSSIQTTLRLLVEKHLANRHLIEKAQKSLLDLMTGSQPCPPNSVSSKYLNTNSFSVVGKQNAFWLIVCWLNVFQPNAYCPYVVGQMSACLMAVSLMSIGRLTVGQMFISQFIVGQMPIGLILFAQILA